MTRRTRILLIALVWVCAAGLCALPSVWPAYAHLIGNRAAETLETEFIGFLAGWTARDVVARRRRASST